MFNYEYVCRIAKHFPISFKIVQIQVETLEIFVYIMCRGKLMRDFSVFMSLK